MVFRSFSGWSGPGRLLSGICRQESLHSTTGWLDSSFSRSRSPSLRCPSATAWPASRSPSSSTWGAGGGAGAGVGVGVGGVAPPGRAVSWLEGKCQRTRLVFNVFLHVFTIRICRNQV